MARWQGKIAADIRESVPDWTPFVQPIGLPPDDVRLSPINPHGDPDGATGPSGQPWPQLDFARPWNSLSADEQQLDDTIIVDVGGEPFHDHEKELQAWLTRD
jgi:hypothetical protein